MSADYNTSSRSVSNLFQAQTTGCGDVMLIYADMTKDGETQIVTNLDIVDAHEHLASLIEEGKIDMRPPMYPGDIHYAILEEQPWRDALDENYLKKIMRPKKKKAGSK